MGAGNARNRQCFCNSGKKYKRCHWLRENEPALPRDVIRRRQMKAFSPQYCLLRSTGQCKGRVISSHSVPKSRLRGLAQDGSVYVLNLSAHGFSKRESFMHFVKKGVSQATTFDAFCSFHDKAVFAPLEDAPFSGTREQLFLLYFRALARELYLKRCQIESTKLLRELDRGRSLADQWAIQEAAAGTMDGIDLALRDLGRMWKLACDALESKNFDSYRSALIYFESVPGMACCGGSLPTFDFGGHRIQTLGLKAECDFLSFTVLPLNITRDGRAGVAAFVWHEDAQQASAIPESLLKFPVARQADAILRLAFETLENVVLSVSWWEGLSASARDRLEGRMRAGLVPLLSTVESLAEDGYQDASWVAMGGSAL